METFQTEAQERAERLGRVLKEEKAVADAQAARVRKNDADCAKTNEAFFTKQAEEEARVKNNKPVILAPKTSEQVVAENTARYPYKPYDPNAIDPLLECEPQYLKDAMGYHPAPLKRSITLTPQPDPRVLAAYNSKKPQPEMAAILDAAHPVVVDGAQIRFTPVRPTVACPVCGDPVSPAAAWHRRTNGEVCVLPGEFNEDLARREGIVIPEKTAPKNKRK